MAAAMTEYLSIHVEMFVIGAFAGVGLPGTVGTTSSPTTSAISTNSKSMIFLSTLGAIDEAGLNGPRVWRGWVGFVTSTVGVGTTGLVGAAAPVCAIAAVASRSKPGAGVVGANVAKVGTVDAGGITPSGAPM